MTDLITIAGQKFRAHGWDYKVRFDVGRPTIQTIVEGMSPVIVPGAELLLGSNPAAQAFRIENVRVRTRNDGKKMTTVEASEIETEVEQSATAARVAATMKGSNPKFVVMDEAEIFTEGEMDAIRLNAGRGSMSASFTAGNITMEQMRTMLGEPPLEPGKFELEALRQEMLQRPAQDDPPALPPCATYAGLDMLPKAGDEIVITEGEQRGWRGRVANSYTRQPTTIECHMTKPDGTRSGGGVPVSQQARYVAKVLSPVPAFGGQDDADAWLTANDREIRPMYVVGQQVRFTYAHRVKRASIELDGVPMKVIEDLELTGKVVAFAPHGPITASQAASAALNSGDGPVMAGPQYKVLTLDLPAHPGTPRIVWVPAALMLG